MARNIVFKLKNDFTGGINFRADQFQLAENESPFLINMEIDPRGGLFTRAGIHFKNTTPIAVSQATWNPKSTFFYDMSTRYIMMSTGFLSTSGEVWYSTGGNFSRLAAEMDITNAVYSTAFGLTTYTTSTAHGFSVGDTITVAGTTPGSYSNTAAITGVTSTTFNFPLFNGNPSSALATPSTTFTASGTSVVAAGTYTLRTQSATSGSGTGAVFTIQKTGSGTAYSGVTTVTVTSGGSGYQVGNTITIPGSGLGGATPANDLTLTVVTKADGLYVSGGTATGPTTLTVSNPNGAAFTQWEQNLYIAAGSGNANIYKWAAPITPATVLTASGTGNWQPYATPVGGYAPRANIIKAHANKMFVANTVEDSVSYPNRLRWSHEGLPEDWEENDYIDIGAGGEGIRALAIVDGQLLIFKPNAIFLLMGYDVDNFQLVEVSTTTGVEYPQHVVEGDGGAYLFDFPKGLFFYNRNGLQDIFLRLSPLIVNNEINSGALDQLSLSYINGRVWMAAPYNPIPNGPLVSYPAVNFIFDQTIGQFGAYTMFQTSDGYGVVTGCNYRDSSDAAWYIMMRPDVNFASYVDDFDNLEDEEYVGASIVENLFQTTYTTSWFYDDRYVQNKTFVGPDYVMKEVELDTTVGVQIYYDFDSTTAVRSQTIQLSAVINGNVYGPSALYDTAIYGTSTVGASLVQNSRFGRCKAIQLEFTGPSAGSPSGRRWGVNSFAYKFKRRNIKG